MRTLYNHCPSKDALIAAHLTARFRHIAPSDAPAVEQILGVFDRLERQWFRSLLESLGVRDPEGLSMQLQILVDGAIATVLVRGDAAVARSARAAAETLLGAAGIVRPNTKAH